MKNIFYVELPADIIEEIESGKKTHLVVPDIGYLAGEKLLLIERHPENGYCYISDCEIYIKSIEYDGLKRGKALITLTSKNPFNVVIVQSESKD